MTDLIFENGTLSLSVNGRIFLSFSNGNEVAEAGTGKSNFAMSHGSFKIKEKTLSREKLFITDIDFSDSKADIRLTKGVLTIEKSVPGVYRFSFNGLDGFNRLWFKLPSKKDENVYGCGEIFPQFNLNGKKVNVWVAEHVNALQIAKKLVKMAFGQENTTRKQKKDN